MLYHIRTGQNEQTNLHSNCRRVNGNTRKEYRTTARNFPLSDCRNCQVISASCEKFVQRTCVRGRVGASTVISVGCPFFFLADLPRARLLGPFIFSSHRILTTNKITSSEDSGRWNVDVRLRMTRIRVFNKTPIAQISEDFIISNGSRWEYLHE